MDSHQQPNGSSNQANNPNGQPNQAPNQEDRPLTPEEEAEYQQMRVTNSARQLTIAIWIQREANRIMEEMRNQLPPRDDWIHLKTSTQWSFSGPQNLLERMYGSKIQVQKKGSIFPDTVTL